MFFSNEDGSPDTVMLPSKGRSGNTFTRSYFEKIMGIYTGANSGIGDSFEAMGLLG